MFIGFYVSAVMKASINNKSIADTESHVADICTWQLGGKGIFIYFQLRCNINF